MKATQKIVFIGLLLIFSSHLSICQNCTWADQAGGTDREGVSWIVIAP